MFSTSFICSIEYNFKYYQKNTTTSFIESHKKILQSTIQIYFGLHATCPIKKRYLSTYFHENSSTEFHKNASSEGRADACGQTNEQA
jgi:hypothetical protein